MTAAAFDKMPDDPGTDLKVDAQYARRLIFGSAAIGSLGTFGMHTLLPALPAVARDMEVGFSTAQLLVSLSLAAIALGNLTVAPLSDRFGRRPITVAGLTMFIIGSLAGLVAPTIEFLILARVVQAYGGGAAMAVARATLTDYFGPDRAARAIAYTAMVVLVVPMLAPTLGGFATEWFGWRAVFVLATLLGTGVLGFTLWRLQETREPASSGSEHSTLASYSRLLRSRDYLLYVGFNAFMMATVHSFITGAPYVAITVLGVRPSEYGMLFFLPAVASFLGFYTTARLSRRVGGEKLMGAGARLSCIGALVMLGLVMLGVAHPLGLFLPAMMITFANATTGPNSTTRAIAAHRDIAGAASGLLGFLQLGLAAVVAQMVAVLENGTAYPLVLTILGCNLVALVCLRGINTRIDQASRPPPGPPLPNLPVTE